MITEEPKWPDVAPKLITEFNLGPTFSHGRKFGIVGWQAEVLAKWGAETWGWLKKDAELWGESEHQIWWSQIRVTKAGLR